MLAPNFSLAEGAGSLYLGGLQNDEQTGNDTMTHSLQAALEKRRKSGNLRALKVFEGADFCSNDYLGLARFPIKAEALGSGSTGSRLIAGHAPAIEHLEERIAAFHGFEAALLFSSGYAANTGLLLYCRARGRDFVR